jgi:nucleoid-associated protein YgaU
MPRAIAILAGLLALSWLGALDASAQQSGVERGAPKAGESQAPRTTPVPARPQTEAAPAETQPEDEMAPGEGQTCPDQGRKLNLIV